MEQNQQEGLKNLVSPPHLLKLSDDILLMILSYLSSKDLMNVYSTCERLAQIACDRTLWVAADFRPNVLTLMQLRKCLKFLRPTTKVFGASGYITSTGRTGKWRTECLSPVLLKSIGKECTNLESLYLEAHYIDAKKIPINIFPETIICLSLKNCELKNKPVKHSYFLGLHSRLVNLATLDLSGCKWMDDYSLMAISKCPKLKELRLNGCVHVGECIAYIALAARFGFAALEVLDLRKTSIGDSEVQSFNRKATLTQLYLSNGVRSSQDNQDDKRVTDLSICTLGPHTPNLHTLVLENCDVTDRVLRYLSEKALSLRSLDVRNTKVTREAVLNFKTERCNCDIISDWR